MIYIESAKKAIKSIKNKYPNAIIINITSKGNAPWNKLSPFYPHNNIPIPFSPGFYSKSVEGVWQGLKVFENSGIDTSKFLIDNMKGIKRTTRKYGKILGHKNGIYGDKLLSYTDARYQIYLPTYNWVLENKVQDLILKLKSEAEKSDVVLLDFDTNDKIENTKTPLSHASLVKKYLETKHPQILSLQFGQVINAENKLQKKDVTPKEPDNDKSSNTQLALF